MPEQPFQSTSETVEVLLDGQPIKLPAGRRSLSAISAYLETIALENQRILCSLFVDGRPAKFPQCPAHLEKKSFSRIEGKTLDLTNMPLRILETALRETTQTRAAVEAAVTLVLINDLTTARELWWHLTRKLKEPLLTLSLLPETIYHPAPGCASLPQMRKWQLQQLATLMKDVDAACGSPDSLALSNALESRILPWLDKLHQTIRLWHQTVLAGVRTHSDWDRDIDQRTIANV
jgi:hypothetical protein